MKRRSRRNYYWQYLSMLLHCCLPTSYSSAYLVFFCLPRILLSTSYSSVYFVFFCLLRILLSTSYSSVYFVFFCLLRILLSTSYSSAYLVFFCLLRILLSTSYSSVYFIFFCLPRILLSTSYLWSVVDVSASDFKSILAKCPYDFSLLSITFIGKCNPMARNTRFLTLMFSFLRYI